MTDRRTGCDCVDDGCPGWLYFDCPCPLRSLAERVVEAEQHSIRIRVRGLRKGQK